MRAGRERYDSNTYVDFGPVSNTDFRENTREQTVHGG